MNVLNKISDITVDDLIDFLRIPKVNGEVKENIKNLLESCLNFTKGRAQRYTNQALEELDKYPELTYPILVGASDCYIQRSSHCETKGTANDVFEKALEPYRVGRIGCI